MGRCVFVVRCSGCKHETSKDAPPPGHRSAHRTTLTNNWQLRHRDTCSTCLAQVSRCRTRGAWAGRSVFARRKKKTSSHRLPLPPMADRVRASVLRDARGVCVACGVCSVCDVYGVCGVCGVCVAFVAACAGTGGTYRPLTPPTQSSDLSAPPGTKRQVTGDPRTAAAAAAPPGAAAAAAAAAGAGAPAAVAALAAAAPAAAAPKRVRRFDKAVDCASCLFPLCLLFDF